MIAKRGKNWVVLNHDGTKTLGTYTTKAEAERRLRLIEYWKKVKK